MKTNKDEFQGSLKKLSFEELSQVKGGNVGGDLVGDDGVEYYEEAEEGYSPFESSIVVGFTNNYDDGKRPPTRPSPIKPGPMKPIIA